MGKSKVTVKAKLCIFLCPIIITIIACLIGMNMKGIPKSGMEQFAYGITWLLGAPIILIFSYLGNGIFLYSILKWKIFHNKEILLKKNVVFWVATLIPTLVNIFFWMNIHKFVRGKWIW